MNRILIVVSFLVGFTVGALLFYPSQETKNLQKEESKQEEWTCAMHPQVRQKTPGKCPLCGMDLVLVGSQTENPYRLVMSAQAARLANIQTEKVTYKHPEKIIYLNGKVQANEKTLYRQTAHVAGRIEQLYLNATGESIHKGQMLASIYSPDLVSAQKELLEAPASLRQAVREKLRNWKLSDQEITLLEQSGQIRTTFPIFADVAGVVSKLEVKQGDYVQAGQVLFEVADLQKVWIWLDAYETDLTWLRKGQRVRYRVHAFPDKELESTIAYISPFVHPDNRTVGIRLEINNEALRLKPEMFVTAQVYAQHPHTGQKSLIIPKTAVLWGGTVSVVYVKLPTEIPTFEMREVVLGEALGNHYVIKEGLSEDEEVVVNGVFAIDATAQLQNKASLMNRNVKTIRQIEQITFKQFMDTATLERLSKITQSYFLLKDALVAADVHQAKKAAQQVVRLTENVALSSSLPEEGKKILAELLATLSLQAKNIVGNENIDAQRRYFIGLSEQIVRLVKAFGGVKEAYLQTCPMADNNKGASWLSLQREIRNPYYGEMMLTCGEVLEKIE